MVAVGVLREVPPAGAAPAVLVVVVPRGVVVVIGLLRPAARASALEVRGRRASRPSGQVGCFARVTAA
ncbi:hypothetical protein GCM10027282_20940 [Frigoribacterium salinisoli]